MRILAAGKQSPVDVFLDGVNVTNDAVAVGGHDEQGAACRGWARLVMRDERGAIIERHGELSTRLLTGEVIWYWAYNEVIH